MTLVVEAPAKINLTLQVLDRRADGYHELDTVFQAIDLWDTLTIEADDDLTLVCDTPGLPTDGTNLVLRAAAALRAAGGTTRGARIGLVKRIPMQGGLGGGSADAAATLLGCARLWGLDETPEFLAPLGRALGADVPFFLEGHTARGTGRGDLITPLAPFGEHPLLLGIPPFGLSTPEVFVKATKRLTLPSNSVSFCALFGHKWKWPNDLGVLVNDLQEGVFESWPALRDFHQRMLAAGASRSLLSGSGSTVFGVFEDAGRRDRALERLSGEFENWVLQPSRTLDEGLRIRNG
jgi:4-diphosphocytidyl-2-C-methyl-D-erythritol kinase